MPLRPYQTRAVAAVRAEVLSGSRAVCLVMPTGSGKTRTAAEIASQSVARGRRVLWLAHRIELVDQARAVLPQEVTVTTVQTLLASGDRPPADVVIIDEAHHYAAAQWRTVLDPYADAIRVGLTATPERGDGTPLGDVFTSLVVGARYSELLAAGHIVDCDVYAPANRLRSALAMPPREAVERYGQGRQTIVFSATVAEARTHADVCIDGETPGDVRADALARFRAGEVQTVSNVYVLTEGFDAPAASCVVLARGCSHASTYLQIVGRVLRASPGKDRAIVVDLTGASCLHGHPTEDREYSLTGQAIRPTKRNTVIWQCKRCGFALWTEPPGRRCPKCQAKMPEPEALKIKRQQLARRDRNATHDQGQRAAAYQQLLRQAEATGRSRGWAAHVFRGRYGCWPGA